VVFSGGLILVALGIPFVLQPLGVPNAASYLFVTACPEGSPSTLMDAAPKFLRVDNHRSEVRTSA
jgi:hypothetical protein